MSHVAQGVFRVVGHHIEGWLAVEYMRHCDEQPELAESRPDKVVSIRDDLWIDSVPIGMVAIEDRLPNTLLRVTVRDRTEVVHVERESLA